MMEPLIANARMYSVSADVGELWRSLLAAVIARAGLLITHIEHAEPLPIEDLWRRPDMGAVFMCGLPFARAVARPVLVAAPMPSPAEFGGEARYWSEFVVRADSAHDSVASAFGQRIAFTVPDSQSGCVAALSYFQSLEVPGGRGPWFAEIIAPTITPLGALGAVIRGAADIAPIDSYAFALLQRHRPDLTAQVRSVGRTAPTPIPPIVGSRESTPRGNYVPGLSIDAHPEQASIAGEKTAGMPANGGFDALSAAFLEAHSDVRSRALMEPLLLKGFSRPDPAVYGLLRQRFAAALRFWSARPLAAVTHPAFVLRSPT